MIALNFIETIVLIYVSLYFVFTMMNISIKFYYICRQTKKIRIRFNEPDDHSNP